MPDEDEDEPLRFRDLPEIARQVARKIGTAGSRIEFGTVQSLKNPDGLVAKASVLMGNAPTGRSIDPTVLCDPSLLLPGTRCAVLFDPPHQAYIIGILGEFDWPIGTLSRRCYGGGGQG